jgi:hypothetical protein
VFLCQCWRQSVQYCVSVPPNFVGYLNNLLSLKKISQKELMRYGLQIILAKGHTQQCIYEKSFAVRHSWSQCGQWSHCAETAIPFIFFYVAGHLTCQHCLTPDMFPIANTSRVQKYYVCLTWYFLVWIHSAKCFTNSSKWFSFLLLMISLLNYSTTVVGLLFKWYILCVCVCVGLFGSKTWIVGCYFWKEPYYNEVNKAYGHTDINK